MAREFGNWLTYGSPIMRHFLAAERWWREHATSEEKWIVEDVPGRSGALRIYHLVDGRRADGLGRFCSKPEARP